MDDTISILNTQIPRGGIKMNITLERIDELRKRANVGYKEAKEALVECDGDMVEAIIFIEERYGVKDSQKTKARQQKERVRVDGKQQIDGFFTWVKKAVDYCNSTRFVIYNKYRTVIDVPLSIAVIAGLVFNVFAILILATAIVTDHRIKFVRKDDTANGINEVISKVQSAAKDVADTVVDTIKSTVSVEKETEKKEVVLDKEDEQDEQ